MTVSNHLTNALVLAIALLGIACASILLVFAEKELSPYAATFNRLSMATLIFLIWHVSRLFLRAGPETIQGSKTESSKSLFLFSLPNLLDIGLMVLSSIAFASSLSLWAWSLTQTSIANSTLLNNMMPIFTTLGAWLFLRESFTPKFLLGMAIAVLGAILIGLKDLQVTHGLIGDEAALGAAMLSAINILSVEQLRKRFETSWIMLWTSFVGSLFVLLIVLALHEQLFPRTMIGWAAVISLAAISQALGQGLLTYSLKVFSAGFVSVSMLAIPFIAAALATVIFDQRLTWFNGFAFGIVLLGIYIAISSQFSKTNTATVLNVSEG